MTASMRKSIVIFLVVFLLNEKICLPSSSADSASPTTVVSLLTSAQSSVPQQEFTDAPEQSEAAKEERQDEKTIMEKFLKNSEVIQFNVGGEIMFTSRASLLHVADSSIAKMLLNQSDEEISIDKDGNVFLDYNPELFRHLLEQLRLFEEDEEALFHPPSTPLLAVPFNLMLKKLGLQPTPVSDDDIVTFNVGDEIVATRRKTLSGVPNSKLSILLSMSQPSDMDQSGKPFLDYDSKLFRHLLSQLQAGQTTNFEAPSTESKPAFNAMLYNLGLNST